MMSNQRDSIKKWMLETHRIDVQSDWLEACLDWIHEEQQEDNVTVANEDSVKNLVFEQWLMSDLRELNSQCLPDGLSDNMKIELNGNFPLQIESIVDVGSSCYSQLQKVKGTENANTGVSADTTLQPAWEQKPSKMLYFKLTDGTSDIQAMEYKPLSCLGVDTILGTKILVYGTVICRRGVLLLTNDNTHVFGGEVDSLIENNTPIVILQKALEENMQHTGKSDVKQFSGKFIERGNGSFQKQQNTSTKSYKSQARQISTNPPSNQNFKREPPSQINIKQNFSQNIKTEPQTQITGRRTFSNAISCVANNSSMSYKQEPVDEWADDFEDDMFMDDIDEQVLISMETEISNQNGKTPQSGNRASAINRNSSSVSNNARNSKNNSTSASNPAKPSTNLNGAQTFTGRLQGEKNNRETTNTPVSHNKRPKLETKQQKLHNMFTAIKQEDTISKSTPAISLTSSHDKEFNVEQFDQFDDDFAAMDDFAFPEPNISVMKPDVPKAVIHPFNSINIENITSEQTNTVNDNEPFTYLSLICDQMPFTTENTFKVKGYISTLTSRLASGQGKVWTLTCKINDGTRAMDVNLSNTVLTSLIGFSAEDSIVMRQQARRDDTVKEILLQGIQQFQQKLVDLSCIFELKVTANSLQPVLTQIITVHTEHTELLLNRIQSKLSSIHNCR